MKQAHSIFGAFLFLAVSVLPAVVHAQEATPSHVYQVVDDINAEVGLMLQANDSTAMVDPAAPELTPRKPRHVIQKAREVFLKVQVLRRINGLPVTELKPFPVRAIKPADVKGMVEQVLVELRGLREPFSVSKNIEPAVLSDGKTPTDVYRNLVDAAAKLDSLGMPKTVPNDVYRVALSVVSDLKKIRAVRGVSAEIPMREGATGKKPGDVYELGVRLLEKVGALAENEGFAIRGGVVMPNLRQGKITPAHVIDILNNVQAEIVAVKLAVGANEPTEVVAPPAGKTPSNVFDALELALEMLDGLQAGA